jgi:hypothetical protein
LALFSGKNPSGSDGPSSSTSQTYIVEPADHGRIYVYEPGQKVKVGVLLYNQPFHGNL